MTFHILLLLPLMARCLGQENPCEGITLGSCFVEEDSILNTYSADPEKCSKLCQMNDNCEFWRAQQDGALCHLLTSDYQHDCESFAGPVSWLDCTEGPDSCYAYVGDDCVYTGERIEADEPNPGDVASIEGCRLWAEIWTDDGVAYFHYNSVTEECHLYRTLDAECQSIGGPKSAPSFDECTTTTTATTTTTTTAPTTTGMKCPAGWTQGDGSCYFLSTDLIMLVTVAVEFCENLGSTLVEVNTAEEDALVLSMAEEAIANGNNTLGQQLDYWTGGVKTDGVWKWRSGAPMDYTNWQEDSDNGNDNGGNFSQLLRNDHDSYRWWSQPETDPDSGVICEFSFA